MFNEIRVELSRAIRSFGGIPFFFYTKRITRFDNILALIVNLQM